MANYTALSEMILIELCPGSKILDFIVFNFSYLIHDI